MARKHKRRTRKRNKKGGFAGILDQKCQQSWRRCPRMERYWC